MLAVHVGVRHALARFGNRFLSEVYRLLDDGETRLGLIGFETIAKSMKHQWIEDASPERFANELRVSDKYSPVRKEDLDADLLSQATKRVAGPYSSCRCRYTQFGDRRLGRPGGLGIYLRYPRLHAA